MHENTGNSDTGINQYSLEENVEKDLEENLEEEVEKDILVVFAKVLASITEEEIAREKNYISIALARGDVDDAAAGSAEVRISSSLARKDEILSNIINSLARDASSHSTNGEHNIVTKNIDHSMHPCACALYSISSMS